MAIGVVLVAYNASDIILECLESLLASTGVDLRIMVVDNCSRDATSQVIRDWAKSGLPPAPTQEPRPFTPVAHGPVTLIEDGQNVTQLGLGEIGLIRSDSNRGFAGGVNLGLEALLANPEVEYLWVLNPDCMAPPDTAKQLETRARAAGTFGVIGGRVLYTQPSNMIQSDGGGRVNLWTGICVPCNLGGLVETTASPDAASLDYITGAHMFVSRDFVTQAGLMPEDYFLYYEEVDWCHRRGMLPLLFEIEAPVYHHGGHSIGSATLDKGPSPLSAYFLNRARMKFVLKYNPLALPLVVIYSTARAVRSLLQGHSAAAIAAARGIWGLAPPRGMLSKIGLTQLPQPRARH